MEPTIFNCSFNGMSKKYIYGKYKYVEKSVEKNIDEKSIVIEKLKPNEVFDLDIGYVNIYDDNYVIIAGDKDETLYFYKTDKYMNIIDKKMYYCHNNLKNYRWRWYTFNFTINRNNLFFYNEKIFKINLDTFLLQVSQNFYSYKSLFTIHKKNNFIYAASYNKGIYVFNIKTLILIKIIYLCNKYDIELQELTLWCVVKNDKLYVNSQIDCSGGYSQIFKIDGIDNKQIPSEYSKVDYPDFIDEKFLIYKDYIYSTGIYDINNDMFIDDHFREINDYSFIQKNYLIKFYNENIIIYDLDENPLLNVIKYNINLEKLIENKNVNHFNFNIIMEEKILFITNNVDKIFLKCKF